MFKYTLLVALVLAGGCGCGGGKRAYADDTVSVEGHHNKKTCKDSGGTWNRKTKTCDKAK